MSERTYSQDEIADLIARAAERQRDARRRADGSGLTLAEIERIGRDSGIDPEHLRAAAAELDGGRRTLARPSGHTRTHVTAERWVDAPLTPEVWEETVAELQGRHGVDAAYWLGHNAGGTVQQVGTGYEWRHTSGMGIQTVVTASPRDGRTRLRLRQLVGMSSPTADGIGLGLLPALLAAPVAGLLTEGVAGGWLAAVLAFLVVWAVAAPAITALDRRWRAGKLRDLEALADDLASLVAGAAPRDQAADETTVHADPRVRTTGPDAPPESRLDLDALDGAPPAPARPADRQRARS